MNEEQTLIARKDKHTVTADLLCMVRMFQKNLLQTLEL